MNYICALDIGASKISGALAEIRNRRISRIFLDSIPSASLKKGAIIDSVGLVNSVDRILKHLKSKSGINIKAVYANISGQDIVTRHTQAIIPLAERGNKVITRLDLKKVNEQARILGSNLEEGIIHQIPFGYAIDSQDNILNPLGLYSHSLETDLFLICVKSASMQSLVEAINKGGCELKGLFFSGLATAKAILWDEEKNKGASVICDIGADTTELLFFKGATLSDIGIITTGGNDLTCTLSKELKIPFDLAEDLKRSHGIVGDAANIKEDKEVLIKKDTNYRSIKQQLISCIITDRATSICNQIKEKLEEKIPLSQIDNFLVCGRTLLLEGFLERLEGVLGISVKLARLNAPALRECIRENEALLGQKYLSYTTALGIVSQVLEKEQSPARIIPKSLRNPLFKAIDKVKEVYQEYF